MSEVASESIHETAEEKGQKDCDTHRVPGWLMEEGDMIVEGTDAPSDMRGFHWRHGMEKCTQGIWMWSHPFLIERSSHETPGDGRIAVLLLDSQGAFDSQMTKDQSATIFGLTAVLSSLQIYNVNMQLQEDKIESLHYFMECAGSCMRLLNGNERFESKLFQHLEFLVRDWSNFDPQWDLEACEKQMKQHLDQHFEHARDKTTPDAIKAMFENISCWMLPHPGLKVNKRGWDGRISDLNPDFFQFLDEYVKRVFGPRLKERTILGQPLTSSTLVQVIDSFVDAFSELVPKDTNLATALARSSNLMSKDEAIRLFKAEMSKEIYDENVKGLVPADLAKLETRCRASAIERFCKQTGFGPPEEREAVRNELDIEIDRLAVFFKTENNRRMESALTIFSGLSLLALFLYCLDRISDFTCDWYSDTCVRFSNALFMVYFTIILAILTNVYLLYQSRGQTVAVVALIEMGKSCFSLLLEYYASIKAIFSDWGNHEGGVAKDDIFRLANRVYTDIREGMRAIQASFVNLSGIYKRKP
jgi:atlastin